MSAEQTTTEPLRSSQADARCVFKDLCLDVSDPERAAAFWAPALGLTAHANGDSYRLGDGTDEHAVWLNRVPEAKTVKNRVHLDLHVAAVDELLDRGAQVIPDDQQPPSPARWTVLADPEGNELCAFVRHPDALPTYRLYELVVDSADPLAITTWWADLFGVPAGYDADEVMGWLEDAPGMPWEMVFGAVPEAKAVKNRVHWDVWGDTPDFLAAGATLLRARDDEIGWDVLADPEGNEFCVFGRD